MSLPFCLAGGEHVHDQVGTRAGNRQGMPLRFQELQVLAELLRERQMTTAELFAFTTSRCLSLASSLPQHHTAALRPDVPQPQSGWTSANPTASAWRRN